jgi:hypothetical protein
MSQTTVGRDEEIDALRAELARSATGSFRTVIVSGDPGMGKTRLAHELLSSTPRGVIALRARGHALGTTTPFGLWAEAFESHLRRLPAERVRWLCGGFLDDLAPLLRSAAAIAQGGSVEPARARVLESFAVLLANIAEAGPVIVVLDDAHLADDSSWEALHYCARNLRSSSVLVVVAARPGELAGQPAAVQVLFGLEQDGDLTRLELNPLADVAVVGRGGPRPCSASRHRHRSSPGSMSGPGATRCSSSVSCRRFRTNGPILRHPPCGASRKVSRNASSPACPAWPNRAGKRSTCWRPSAAASSSPNWSG